MDLFYSFAPRGFFQEPPPDPDPGTFTSIMGIPDPDFGIEEETPGEPPEWPGGVATGYYYVDNTHASATNTSNPNGWPNRPRTTIPTTLAAGSVVYVRGGPYSGQAVLNSGTEADPIFISGDPDTRTVFNGIFDLQGTRAILERVHISGGGNGRIRIGRQSNADSFLVVRDCEVSGTTPTGSGITLLGPSDCVIYNSHIHDINNGGGETHGVSFGSSPAQAERNWIIDNIIEEVGADCIQFQQGGVTGSSPTLVYIGRNTLNPWNSVQQESENCIDLKACGIVIISQNDMSGTQNTSTGNGELIRVNNGEGTKDGAIWVIFNTFHDGFAGIDPGGNQTYPNGMYLVGNIFYNIDERTIGEDHSHVVGNTVYNCTHGILQATAECRNNILHTIASGAAISNATNCTNNLVFNSTAASGCSSGQTGDPLFVNPGAADFSIQSGSPARGAATTASVYATWTSTFGTSIAFDHAGNDLTTDIGALMFGS